jgi:DNA-binding HxlR family transcriptional regulator
MTEQACAGSDPACRCVLSELFDVLGRKYAMGIVCVTAAHGTVRFGALEAHLPGASTSTLSTRLEELGAAGVIDREQYDEIPPRVEYELTDRGGELADRLRPLAEWIVADEGS